MIKSLLLFFSLLISNNSLAKEEINNKVFKYTSISSIDVSTSLDKVAQQLGEEKLDKKTLYYGQSLIPIQKTSDGYIFTPNPQIFRSSEYGVAFLKTKKKLNEGPFCAWMHYISDISITTASGFPKKIPAFEIYNGKAPNKVICIGQSTSP